MPNYDDVDRVIDMINESRISESKKTGFPVPLVADDEVAEAHRWADGQELKNIIDAPGFEIIMSLLEGYMDDGIKLLFRNTIPTDKDAVLANFAVGHAACEILERLKNDIKARLNAAENMPEVIKQGIRLTRGTPVDASSLTPTT